MAVASVLNCEEVSRLKRCKPYSGPISAMRGFRTRKVYDLVLIPIESTINSTGIVHSLARESPRRKIEADLVAHGCRA